MQCPLQFFNLGGAGTGKAVCIMPELFLINTRQPFQGRFSEDLAIHLEKGPGVHPEYNFIIALYFFWNGISKILTSFFQYNQSFFQTFLNLIQCIANSANSVYFFKVSSIVGFCFFNNCM